MARLVVVSSARLADGFRLTGATTVVARAGREAAGILRSLADEPDIGLLLVTAELWASVDDRLRGMLERLPRPIVLAIPAGVVTEGTSHRELLGEMLKRAIGYRIELVRGEER